MDCAGRGWLVTERLGLELVGCPYQRPAHQDIEARLLAWQQRTEVHVGKVVGHKLRAVEKSVMTFTSSRFEPPLFWTSPTAAARGEQNITYRLLTHQRIM